MYKFVDVLSWCPGVEAVSVMLTPKPRAIVPKISSFLAVTTQCCCWFSMKSDIHAVFDFYMQNLVYCMNRVSQLCADLKHVGEDALKEEKETQ